METVQVKKSKVIYEEMFPFRKSGDMVSPDSEVCKKCKGTCCRNGVFLRPYDFEEGKEVASIIKLLKMELVELSIDGYFNGCINVSTSWNDDSDCIFKCVWGCIIPADMRPLICKFYGPSLPYASQDGVVCHWKGCRTHQTCAEYSDNRNWEPYRNEFLKQGLLECPNVSHRSTVCDAWE